MINRDTIIERARHRQVPEWVIKLVMDCVEIEREEIQTLVNIEWEDNEAAYRHNGRDPYYLGRMDAADYISQLIHTRTKV